MKLKEEKKDGNYLKSFHYVLTKHWVKEYYSESRGFFSLF
jgi:hypothetical protein